MYRRCLLLANQLSIIYALFCGFGRVLDSDSLQAVLRHCGFLLVKESTRQIDAVIPLSFITHYYCSRASKSSDVRGYSSPG